MAKKLTEKQAKFVKEYTKNGGNGSAAAKVAYNSGTDLSARVEASRTLTNANVQQALLRAAERMGITEEKIMQPVVDALNDEQLDMRLKGHDRIVKLINGKENGVSLNIENAQGIEITFKNMGADNAEH